MSVDHFLVDKSAFVRIDRSPSVRTEVVKTVWAGGVLASCVVTEDEAAFSARDVSDLATIRKTFAETYAFFESDDDTDAVASEIRDALFARGQGRAAQTTDVLIAACAVRWGLTVLHYDHDFEVIAGCYPALQHRWVVPRGSVA